MFPINQRFWELCLALNIDPQDRDAPQEVGTKPFYVGLRRKVLNLLESRFELVDGALGVETQHERLRNTGLAASLWRELNGSGGKTKAIEESTARSAMYRLHGLIETSSGGWVLPPPNAGEPDGSRKPIQAQFEQVFSVVPQLVRERIHELCLQRRDLMDRYIADAVRYLQAEVVGLSLPEPPWNHRYEFTRGHEFIDKFLDCARNARLDITLAAVDFYITASIGRSLFLERLKCGVRVRVLIFDFVRGDVPHVARMIRRSPEVLCALSNETVEALLWLREAAASAGVFDKLEVRLLDRDPRGRWYIVDALRKDGHGQFAFTVPRASDTATRATDSGGGWEVTPEIVQAHAREVEELWQQAEPIDAWLPAYERWKILPETKRLLGE